MHAHRSMTDSGSIRTLVAFAILACAAACSPTPVGVESLAGRYELRSVNRRALPTDGLGAALDGELLLSRDGRATRVVRHATSGVPGPIVRRASGTYRRHGTELMFRLVQEGLATPEATWQVRGVLARESITLRFLGPGDALTEEVYVRVP